MIEIILAFNKVKEVKEKTFSSIKKKKCFEHFEFFVPLIISSNPNYKKITIPSDVSWSNPTTQL
jgi:hypothetical protein